MLTSSEEKPSTRNAGIDLFKCLCMFFVIWFHYSDHGTIKITASDPITFNWCVLAISRIFGGICNCAFVLTTGYFLCEKKFNVKRIIKLLMEVWFYSVLCGVVSYCIKTDTVTIKSIIKMLFPFTFYQYWYFSAYIILIAFSPFINILIKNMDKRQHLILVIMCALIYIALPTLRIMNWVTKEVFFFLYILAAYIKKYGIVLTKHNNIKNVTLGFLGVLGILVEIISIFCMKEFLPGKGMFYFVWGMDKLPCIFTSLMLFLFFSNINVKESKLLSFISSSIFSVYLLHIGRLHTMWFQRIFNNAATYETKYMILQLITCSFVIFTLAILLDKIRINCFENPVMKIIDRINERLCKRNRFFCKWEET